MSEPEPKHELTPMEIGVVIGSVAIALLILLTLVFVMALRRPHHRHKYEKHPEHGPQETHVLKPFKDNLHSMFKHAEAEPLITAETEQSPPPRESGYLKHPYTQSSSDKHRYEDHATHETHIVTLDTALSPKNGVRFETAALHSSVPSSSKSTIKFAPLSIPEKTLNHSNGERSTKRAFSIRSSKHPDSGWESDESASIYSMASASTYFSFLQPFKPPPVPAIPAAHLASPTQSTSPKGTDVITDRRDEEQTITKSTLPPLSRPSIKFNGDNGEEEDENQIYNVAKLLRTRQSKLPSNAPSRNSSIVSHIERSGSIRPIVFLSSDEKSYRPRYYHLKHQQKRDSKRISRGSTLSPTLSPDSLTPSSTSHPQAPQVR